MVDSDGDIYRKVKEGISPRILAELNACGVDAILDAKKRYEEYLKNKPEGMTYPKWLKLKEEGVDTTKTIHTVPTLPKTSINGKRKNKRRFIYSKEMQEKLYDYLCRGVPRFEIYNALFEDKKSNKPSYKAFENKCSCLMKEIKTKREEEKKRRRTEQKEVIVPSKLTKRNGDTIVLLKNNTQMIKELKIQRDIYQKEVEEAQHKLTTSIYKLASIDDFLQMLEIDTED